MPACLYISLCKSAAGMPRGKQHPGSHKSFSAVPLTHQPRREKEKLVCRGRQKDCKFSPDLCKFTTLGIMNLWQGKLLTFCARTADAMRRAGAQRDGYVRRSVNNFLTDADVSWRIKLWLKSISMGMEWHAAEQWRNFLSSCGEGVSRN
jgi:hypothetical protein